jgi:hypothetical protein
MARSVRLPHPGVLVAGGAAVVLGAVWLSHRSNAAAGEKQSPAWLRTSQPPQDATYVMPASWSPVQPVQLGAAGDGAAARDRSWPDTWVPLTGGPNPAWAWAGGPEGEP